MSHVIISTAAHSLGGSQGGGYAAVLRSKQSDKTKEVSDADSTSTNHVLELKAVLLGVTRLKRRCFVELRSTSPYVIDGLNKVTKTKANAELWSLLWNSLIRHEYIAVRIGGSWRTHPDIDLAKELAKDASYDIDPTSDDWPD